MPEAHRRRERIEAGVCATCGTGEPAAAAMTCGACTKRVTEANAARRERLQGRKMCDKCGLRRARKHRRTCKACGRYWIEANAAYRERRRDA